MNQETPAYPPATQPAKDKRPPKGWAKLWAALGLGVAAFGITTLIQLVAVLVDPSLQTISQNALLAVSEFVGGICALLFIVALGGKEIARPSTKGMGEAWRAAGWLFVVNGTIVALGAIGIAMGVEPIEIAENWPARTALLALLCLSIGLFEESTMRGLCLNGLLARMGRTRAGVYGAVILSSLMFGFLHFDPFIDFGNPMEVAQDILKVVQSGMCGFLFACILVKTRNIWAVAIIHGVNDFMLLFMANGLVDADVAPQYVISGEEAGATLAIYIVFIVLYLPFIPIGKKLVDQASPWRGGFYPHEPARPLVQPAWSPPVAVAIPIDDATAKAMRGKHARISTAGAAEHPIASQAPAEGRPHDQNL